MSREKGLCLLEALVASSVLATSSLFLLELQLWCQRESYAQTQMIEVRQALLDRLALARLQDYQDGVLFIPREISGVSFSQTNQQVVTDSGHQGNKITLTADWIDPHNIPRKLTFNALIAL